MAYDPLEDMRQSALCRHSAWMHKARENALDATLGRESVVPVLFLGITVRTACYQLASSWMEKEKGEMALQNVPGASASRQSPFFWKLALLGSFEEIRA